MSEPFPQQDELRQWDSQHLWHAFTQMQDYEPFIIERADGCYLYDIDGKRYLDAESSLWCNVHGHRHPDLDRALTEQLERVAHVTLLGMSSDTIVRLAKMLTDTTPGQLDHVFFSSDGACAVEVALKQAVQYWQLVEPGCSRDKFLCFEDAYHGDTLGTISVGGVDRFNRVFKPLLFDTVRGPLPSAYHLPKGVLPSEASSYYLQQTRDLLKQHADELAGVIIEPLVQCAAGMVAHPHGFLAGLADLCREFNTLLIADEIAVGFGKTGTLYACQQEQVIPDFLCLGKGLTGGYLPLSATVTTPRIWNAFLGPPESHRQFCHGHTFGGNPLAAAVAIENLKLLQKPDCLDHVKQVADRLAEHLLPLKDHRHVGDIRQQGLIVGIELVADRETRLPFESNRQVARRICQNATRRGVWLRPLQDVIVIMPPLAIQAEQIDQIASVLIESLLEELPY